MNTALETNEAQTTSGETAQPGATGNENVVNDVADAIRDSDASHKQTFKEVSQHLDNIGEKRDFKREEVVKNPTAEKPDTPNIKVAMYMGFVDEFEKIASSHW